MPQYIVFIAEVQTPQIAKLREALTNAVNARADEIQLFISSGGGSVSEGLNIAAFMRTLPTRIITHNIGQIDSVANVIFAAGITRYANQNASFLYHGVTLSIEKQNLIESQLEENHKIVKRLRENIATAFAEYTGMTVADVQTLMISGASILQAAEAVQRGIVNEIRNAAIPAGSQIVSIGNA